VRRASGNAAGVSRRVVLWMRRMNRIRSGARIRTVNMDSATIAQKSKSHRQRKSKCDEFGGCVRICREWDKYDG
jgi:hypothetical protein